jgi:hypothetical protein
MSKTLLALAALLLPGTIPAHSQPYKLGNTPALTCLRSDENNVPTYTCDGYLSILDEQTSAYYECHFSASLQVTKEGPGNKQGHTDCNLIGRPFPNSGASEFVYVRTNVIGILAFIKARVAWVTDKVGANAMVCVDLPTDSTPEFLQQCLPLQLP